MFKGVAQTSENTPGGAVTVHVHGRRVQRLVEPLRKIPPEQVIAVSVDAGKASAVALIADFTGERLCRTFPFKVNRSGIAELVARVQAVSETADRHARLVRVGVEASGLSPAVGVADGKPTRAASLRLRRVNADPLSRPPPTSGTEEGSLLDHEVAARA